MNERSKEVIKFVLRMHSSRRKTEEFALSYHWICWVQVLMLTQGMRMRE